MTSTTQNMNTINNDLIGMCSRKRCGKDTAGNYLIEKYGYIQYAFAAPLKKACQEIFMFTDEQTEGHDKEKYDDRWNISARKVFQIFGTEMFRQKLGDFFPEMEHIKENFWIYRFEMWYAEQKRKNPNVKVVVTDIRFPNEAAIVKKLGGRVIKVNRNTGMLVDGHSSEKNIDLIKGDVIIENNGTLEEYYQKVEKALGNDINKTDCLKSQICNEVDKINNLINKQGNKGDEYRFCLYYNTVLSDCLGRDTYYVPLYPEILLRIKSKIESIKGEKTLEQVLDKLKCFRAMIFK